MEPPRIRLRDVTMDDADLLLGWRNDPLTRQMSRDRDAVERNDHVAWLARTLALDAGRRRICIAVADGTPVGTVRLDRVDDGVCELSWTMAPEARGQGLGREMVSAFCRMTGGRLRAVVRAGNAASRRIAISAGLSPIRIDGDLEYFEGDF
ncbi:MAG: GNAT family N-acetyltransferase [Sphingomonadales bacterium]